MNAGIQLNDRVSLRRSANVKQRKPKDLAKKLDKSLRVRYSEVVKLRELVKKAQSQVRGNGKSSDRRR
jgi:hypothetical protein